MDWQAEWNKTQQELSAASRNEYWWKTLPEERRSMLGRQEYRKQCRLARLRVKLADERCRSLMRMRRDKRASSADAAGELVS